MIDFIITYYKIIIIGLLFLTPNLILFIIVLKLKDRGDLQKQIKTMDKKLKKKGLKK